MPTAAAWPGNEHAGKDGSAPVYAQGQAGIAEQLERAVHGGLPNAGIARDHVLVEFFKGVVPRQFKKCLGNDASLGCGVQAFAAHEIQKIRQADVLLLCSHMSAHLNNKWR